MLNHLSSHMRNFADGKVSVESLTIAAQAERADRATANRVLQLIAESTHSTWSSAELRERARLLI